MTKELKQFLQEKRTLIEREQFYELYCAVSNKFKYSGSSYIRELSEFLINCDLDPLEYLPDVPTGYLNRSSILQHVVIPDNVELVGRAAFMNSGIRSVTFHDTSKCTHIIDYAFQDCDNLETVILPPACENISVSAFRNCKYLQTVVIPTKSNRTYIASDAFDYCDNLTIYCNPGTTVEYYCIDKNINYKFIDPEKRKY